MSMLDAAAERADGRATTSQVTNTPVTGEPCVLLKLGELVLKGKNRDLFERRLQNNIRSAVKGLGVKIQVWQREGVIVVRTESGELADVDAVARRMTDVMGIVWVHRAWRVAKEPDAAVQAALDLVGPAPGARAQGRVRGPRPPSRQALPDDLVGAEHPRRHEGPGALRPAGQPEAPRHHGLHRGRPARGVRLHRRHAGRGRPARRHERPRAGPDVRRHRLAGRRLPHDAPRPARRLPALLRDALHRPRIDLQGVRAGPRAGQVPGRVPAVRRAVRQGAAADQVLRRRPAADHRAAPPDAARPPRSSPTTSAARPSSPATPSAR